MPLYEYECDQCGHRFEAIRKFSDPPVDQCPKCGGAVRKMQSAPAFHLKGTGWYATDYAKKPPPAESKSEGDAKDSKASTGEKKEGTAGEKKDAPPKADSTPAKSSGTTDTATTPAKKD